MTSGEKTKNFGKVAAVSFPAMFVDPTGASAVAFLGAGTGFVAGGLFHGTRKALRGAQRLLAADDDDNRERPAPPPTALVRQPRVRDERVGDVFQRLASAAGGVVIQGVLFCHLPIFGVAFLFSLKDLVDQSKRLRRLKHDAGGSRALLQDQSFPDLVKRAIYGLSIKTVTTFVFIGNEFTDFVDTIDRMGDYVQAHASQAPAMVPAGDSFAAQLKDGYGGLIEHHPLEETTKAASMPIDLMKDLVAGEGAQWAWEDNQPIEAVAPVAGVIAGVDQIQKMIAEEPLHKQVSKGMANQRK